MKFWEAMKLFDEGKKVRCVDWPVGDFVGYGSLHLALMNHDRLSYAKQWELYSEPVKTFTFSDVVKGLKDGKRFKRKGLSEACLVCVNGGLYWKTYSSPCSPLQFWNTSIEDLEAKDWIEVI